MPVRISGNVARQTGLRGVVIHRGVERAAHRFILGK
jgi:hypothetical protein